MTIISEDSLDFARNHITTFHDSDLFPKPFEYEAIWHCWNDVKAELLSKNIPKFWVTPPRTLPVPKPSGDYRVAHQLEPIDSIIYTAIAHQIAGPIEAARMPEGEKIACSYRLKPKEGNFFGEGSGYPDFIEQTEKLAKEYPFVLITDISDFYNQIYLHRLNNAIEYADPSLKPLGDDAENFISRLNAKSSQGIPVGPAASTVFAEAVLIDVDNAIRNFGHEHTRYVDDFRIFGNDYEQLRSIQQELTIYLYQNHRLTLNGSKTYISASGDFVQEKLRNPIVEEKDQLFRSIEIFNPYTEDVEEVEFEVVDEEEKLVINTTHVIQRLIDIQKLDLGLARSALRRARQNSIPDIAELIIPNIAFFSPVINDVILYLNTITNDDFAQQWADDIGRVLRENPAKNEYIVRFWLEWYLAQHRELLRNDEIRNFMHVAQNYVHRATTAITERDLAWVRQQKPFIYQKGSWEKRALLNAARVLPGDERNHWLRLTEASSPILIDRWVARWVRETA